MFAQTFAGLIAILAAVASLSGCSTESDAIVSTFRAAWRATAGAAHGAPLNPSLRYLRTTSTGGVSFLVLGNLDRDANGPIEVWYSSSRAVFRLQNGRVIGLSGTDVEWAHVVVPALPSWSAIARSGTPLEWARQRDVMPGYRLGTVDHLTLRRITPPSSSELVGTSMQELVWFEEQAREDRLPVARYAIDMSREPGAVVYGEQCFSPTLCLTWQRWPPDAAGTAVSTK